MILKTLLTLTAVLLVLPVAANAETITHDPGAVPPGTKSTTVLKGYIVRNSYSMPSAPVYGEPSYAEDEVFVPVEDMATKPQLHSTDEVQDTEHKNLKTYQGMWSGNE